MNKEIMEKHGFLKQIELAMHGKCPKCEKGINMKDFKNKSSLREFEISGLCQKCQNDFFGEE